MRYALGINLGLSQSILAITESFIAVIQTGFLYIPASDTRLALRK